MTEHQSSFIPDQVVKQKAEHVAIKEFVTAVSNLPVDLRPGILSEAYDHYRPGSPLPAFFDVMSEAKSWAWVATRTERKCYALACFEALGEADKAAFLKHVGGRQPP